MPSAAAPVSGTLARVAIRLRGRFSHRPVARARPPFPARVERRGHADARQAGDKAGGNARAVRNALEQAKRQQALRLVSIPGKKSADTLVLLTVDDMPGA